MVFWYVGSVVWDALHLTRNAQLSDPHTWAMLLLPAALAARPIPMWVIIGVAAGLAISFIACLVADLRSLFGAERELNQRPSAAEGRGSPYPGPLLWPLLLVVSIAITVGLRPARADATALGETALIILVACLLLGAGATVVVMGVRRPAGWRAPQLPAIAADTDHPPTRASAASVTRPTPLRSIDHLMTAGRIDLAPLAETVATEARRARRASTWLFGGMMLLIVAALAAATLAPQLPGTNAATGFRLLAVLVAVVCVVLAGVVAMVRMVSRIDDRRMVLTALSGVAMSLSWRYAVGGKPLAVVPAAPDESIGRYYELLAQALDVTVPFTPLPPSGQVSAQVTDDMRTIRAADLDVRRAMYARGRLQAMSHLYRVRAQQGRGLVMRWSGVALGLITLGAACAVAALVGALPVYPASVLVASVLVTFCWIERPSYGSQARKDAALSVRLLALHARCIDRLEWSEAAWSEFVDSAETTVLSAQDAYLVATMFS